MATEKQLMRSALAKANAVRKTLGKPPVTKLYAGRPNQGNDCPITNTIFDDDLSRDEYSVFTGYDGIRVWHDENVDDYDTEGYIADEMHTDGSKEFIKKFDESPSKFPDDLVIRITGFN